MPDPKHNSVTSSTYSGQSDSVATATQQDSTPVKKIEGRTMMSSAEAARKRRQDKAEERQKAREQAEKEQK